MSIMTINVTAAATGYSHVVVESLSLPFVGNNSTLATGCVGYGIEPVLVSGGCEHAVIESVSEAFQAMRN